MIQSDVISLIGLFLDMQTAILHNNFSSHPVHNLIRLFFCLLMENRFVALAVFDIKSSDKKNAELEIQNKIK
jgi:hypothetical protein